MKEACEPGKALDSRRSGELLRAIMENTPALLYVLDRDGRFIIANGAVAALLGAAPDELVGKTRHGLMPEEAALQHEENDRRVIESGSPLEFEEEGVFDGKPTAFLTIKFPIRDESGEVYAVAGMSTIFTDRKKAEEELKRALRDLAEENEHRRRVEEELRESEERLRSLAEALPQIVWTADAEGAIDWFNRRWYEYTGAPPGVGERWSWDKVAHPDDMARTLKNWQSAREEGLLFQNEIRVRRHDGRYGWFLVRAWPLRNAEGKVVRWFGTNTDIDEMKAVELALQQSRKDLDRAQEVGQIGSWRLDVRQNVLTWSDENYRIFDVPEGTPLTYETFLGSVHPDDRTYVDTQWQAGTRGEPYDIEHRIVTGQGTKWVREKAYLEFDEAGRLLGGFGITQDITERRRAEEELRGSREEIAHNFALLQRALLPGRPPEFPGYEIASAYVPVTGAGIGGDFYDLFVTESGSFAVSIGDVAGKGVPSASLATAVRSTVRAFAYDLSLPGETLSHANAILKGMRDDPTLFVTVSLAVIEEGGWLRYATAGHPPPVIFRARTGEVSFLTGGGVPLGLLERNSYEESEGRLEVGDRLVLYTDGLPEARHGGKLFGYDGIRRVLEESGGLPPEELIQALIGASTDFSRGRRLDDTAVIVLGRNR